MEKNSQGFVHFLLVIVALVGIGALGYNAYKNEAIKLRNELVDPHTFSNKKRFTLEKNQDITLNWNTYINKKYNYTFKYPEEFSIFKEDRTGFGDRIYPASENDTEISILIAPEKSKSEVDVYFSYNLGSTHKSSSRKEEIWEINDVKYAKILPESEFVAVDIYYPLERAETFTLQVSTNPDKSTLANQILSTFNFLSENAKVACGGWDTSGKVICKCSGKLIEPTFPQGVVVDGAAYLCEGQCSGCCYKGIAENSSIPKCIN